LDEKVDSIVDLTAVGLGRFIPRIARVAQRTQPNIIIATGIYTYRVRALFLSFARAVTRNVDIMTEMFVGDIEKGVGDTGLRAGILKYATEQHGVTKDVERIPRAVAQVHRPLRGHEQSRLPRTTHRRRFLYRHG